MSNIFNRLRGGNPHTDLVDIPSETLHLKNEQENIEVGYELIPLEKIQIELTPEQQLRVYIQDKISSIDTRLDTNEEKIRALNAEIDRLTNYADQFDYLMAVGSGILAGIIDSLWAGDFSLKRGKAWSNKAVNSFVMDCAKKFGYSGNRLDGAIKTLEDTFPVASDNIWKGKNVGISARSHHLDDFAHHPTPLGLFFSILTQFTHQGYFQNADGTFLSFDVVEGNLIGQNTLSKLFAGTINWFYHLASDMSGSNKTAGVGMGIPGPVVSMLKEFSALPIAAQTQLPQLVKKAFVQHRFDFRSELAVGYELGRQSFPVVINEILVRSCYFMRRVYAEYKNAGSFDAINWANAIPFNNRTIARMITVATGSFVAVDLADASLRSLAQPGSFSKKFVLRVNIVGIGRFTVALCTDIKMGIKREQSRNARMRIYMEQLHLCNAKLFYTQANTWLSAKEAKRAINEAYETMNYTSRFFVQSLNEMENDLIDIGNSIKRIKKQNPRFIEELLEEL